MSNYTKVNREKLEAFAERCRNSDEICYIVQNDPDSRIDASGLDLSSANLEGANLRNANLTNLSWTELEVTDITGIMASEELIKDMLSRGAVQKTEEEKE